MTHAKLTSEDIDWLERRIRAVVGSPVSPRPQFVNEAKAALLREAVHRQAPRWAWWSAAYFMVCLAGLLLIVVVAQRRRLCR